MRYAIEEDWLRDQYCEKLQTVAAIAASAGCSVHTIKKKLKDWRILRGKILQSSGIVKAWNDGLTKDTDKRLKAISELHSGEGNPMSGRTPWNRGLKAIEDERLARIVAYRKGFAISEETRSKMRKAKEGRVGAQANNWRGGLTYAGGYGVHRRTVDGRRMYAHRHVAEQALGRVLNSQEEVHHIDCDKANNEATNLLVLTDADHNRLHRAIEDGEVSRDQQIHWLNQNGIKYEALA